jgi:hypothetical protein
MQVDSIINMHQDCNWKGVESIFLTGPVRILNHRSFFARLVHFHVPDAVTMYRING